MNPTPVELTAPADLLAAVLAAVVIIAVAAIWLMVSKSDKKARKEERELSAVDCMHHFERLMGEAHEAEAAGDHVEADRKRHRALEQKRMAEYFRRAR